MSTSAPVWPTNAMVGYVDMTATGSMAAITADQVQAYNVIIFGFANADGTVNSTDMQGAQAVIDMETEGTINMISLGGAAGTVDLSQTTVDNLVQTLQTYSLDGVDLDIEDGSVTIGDLTPFVTELQSALSGSYLLTMAPILAGTPDAPTLNIPGGVSLEPIYSQPGFDAILVQAYNSGTYFSYPLPSDPSQNVNEADPNIISAAYNALQQNGGIDSSNAIVIGIPTNAGGAPSESNLWDTSDYSAIPPVISQNLQDISTGQYGIDASQFGGLMAWSLNTDADPNDYPGFTGSVNGPAGYFAANVAPMMQNPGAGSEKAAE